MPKKHRKHNQKSTSHTPSVQGTQSAQSNRMSMQGRPGNLPPQPLLVPKEQTLVLPPAISPAAPGISEEQTLVLPSAISPAAPGISEEPLLLPNAMRFTEPAPGLEAGDHNWSLPPLILPLRKKTLKTVAYIALIGCLVVCAVIVLVVFFHANMPTNVAQPAPTHVVHPVPTHVAQPAPTRVTCVWVGAAKVCGTPVTP